MGIQKNKKGAETMKVVIKNAQGKYLSSSQGTIKFVDTIEQAFVYDYDNDKVEEQLSIAKSRFGFNWSWEDVGKTDGLLCLPKRPYVSSES